MKEYVYLILGEERLAVVRATDEASAMLKSGFAPPDDCTAPVQLCTVDAANEFLDKVSDQQTRVVRKTLSDQIHRFENNPTIE